MSIDDDKYFELMMNSAWNLRQFKSHKERMGWRILIFQEFFYFKINNCLLISKYITSLYDGVLGFGGNT